MPTKTFDEGDFEGVAEEWEKFFHRETWHLLRAFFPHRCTASNRRIWPGQKAYVSITNHKFMKSWPTEYKWIHKDEYLILKIKGEI